MLGAGSYAISGLGAKKVTVQKNGVGSDITQKEKDIAGSYYNSNTNTIDMAEIHDLNFGPNYISQLGADDEWMALAQTNLYKKTFQKATGESGTNLSFADAIEAGKLWNPVGLNKDANNGNTKKSGQILRYPINQEKDDTFDYLQICSYENKPAKDLFVESKDKKGNTTYGFKKYDKKKGSGASISDVDDRYDLNKSLQKVYLPMQPGLQDASSVSWNQDTLNPMDILLAGATGGTVEGAAQGGLNALMQGGGNLMSGIGDLVGDIDKSSIAAWAAGQVVGKNVLGRATGKAINNNLELLFSGPTLRTFAYSYRFTPREEDEALMVKKIIKFFKKSMAPTRTNNKIFLESPNVFKLKYIYGPTKDQHPFLNKIKMCALQSFNVQYTPDGSYSTYDDGSMTSYQVDLQFGELNPIYADDYDDSDNDMGY